MNCTNGTRNAAVVLIASLAVAMPAAVAAAPAMAAEPHGAVVASGIGTDSGLAGCMTLGRVAQVQAAEYPGIRILFSRSRWADLRIAGTAYVDIATALLRRPHAYGGETVWFYERLSAACAEHGHALDGGA